MAGRLKVGAAVVNQTPFDWDRNEANLRGALRDARTAGVSLLCLPELAITGYGCEDAFYAPHVAESAAAVLQGLLAETLGMFTCFGLPVSWSGALYNAAAIALDGRLIGVVPKQHLAGDGLHYEPRWFKPWPAGQHTTLTLCGQTVPFGDLLFEVGGVRIGFEICEDAWVADRPGAHLGRRGVEVILNPSASHFAFDKIDVRRRLVIEGSRAFGAAYVYTNLVGNEAGRAIYDGGAIIATDGELIAEGPRFTYQPWLLTTAVVDLDVARTRRSRTASFRPLHGPDDDRVTAAFDWPFLPPSNRVAVSRPSFEALSPEGRRLESFTRAIGLALLDYLTKSHARGFVISLSGGADSAAVALLVVTALDLFILERGLPALLERLGRPSGTTRETLRRELLTCVYQSTRNSGERTLNAARGVAAAVGAKFAVLDVDPLVAAYTERGAAVIGRALDWTTDDIALQNVQARVRAPGVWLVANVEEKLLLATSNRSEAAVGYATMDGDTCGGLSPIAGIDKAFLLRWLAWMEVEGPAGVGPTPALSLITSQAPTAELRPPGEAQTDEKDLMPYPVLDAIERAAIGELRAPIDLLAVMVRRFPQYPARDMAIWVERFYRLFTRNQWKRERYAPSFHVDDENMDPKTWCRFPILSGGFVRELEAVTSVARGLAEAP